MLWQSGAAQSPDEDGSERDSHWSCELHAGGAGAGRGPEAHQLPEASPSAGVRHLHCGGPHRRTSGNYRRHSDYCPVQEQEKQSSDVVRVRAEPDGRAPRWTLRHWPGHRCGDGH